MEATQTPANCGCVELVTDETWPHTAASPKGITLDGSQMVSRGMNWCLCTEPAVPQTS